MIFHNETIFLIHIIIISSLVSLIISYNNIFLLHCLFSLFILIINICINQKIFLFGITTTTVEPYTIGLFWIGGYFYRKYGDKGTKEIIQSMILTTLGFVFFTYFTNFYTLYESNDQWENWYALLLRYSNFSLFLSTITFFITYYIERKLFNQLKKYFSLINSQTLSIIFSQLFDTIIFTIIYFYDLSNKNIINIATFSFFIKFLCIISFQCVPKMINKIKSEPATTD